MIGRDDLAILIALTANISMTLKDIIIARSAMLLFLGLIELSQ
jgi:hypothetical protein